MPTTTPGFDINAFIQAMLQMQQGQQQGRLQSNREQSAGAHRGIGGGYIDPNTNKEAGNAFDSGFFNQSASQLSPEQRAQSQGSTAMNQWARPDMFGGSRPSSMTQAEGAVNASAPMFRVSPETLAFAGLSPRPYALGDERSPQMRQPMSATASPGMKPFGATAKPKRQMMFGAPQRNTNQDDATKRRRMQQMGLLDGTI